MLLRLLPVLAALPGLWASNGGGGHAEHGHLSDTERQQACATPQTSLPATGSINYSNNGRAVICLEVSFGSKKANVPFIVDSGSAHNWIDRDVLEKEMGLEVSETVSLVLPQPPKTSSSSSSSTPERVPFRISAGRIAKTNILGVDYFKKFGLVMKVDYPNTQVTLSASTTPMTNSSPLRSDSGGSLSTQDKIKACQNTEEDVPAKGTLFFDNHGRAVVCFKVTHQSTSRRVAFVIDTGSPVNLIREDTLKNLGITQAMGSVNVMVPGYKAFSDAKHVHPNTGRPTGSPPTTAPTEFSIASASHLKAHNLLGVKYFRMNNLQLSIDYAAGTVNVEQPKVLLLNPSPPTAKKADAETQPTSTKKPQPKDAKVSSAGGPPVSGDTGKTTTPH